MNIGAAYFGPAFRQDGRDESIVFAREAQDVLGFDTIAVSGVSGTLMGGVIAHALGCHLLVVRKEDDKSTHSWMKVEGHLGSRFAFLDDLSETGATRDYVVRSVRRVARGTDYEPPISTRFVGSLYYTTGQITNGLHRPVRDPFSL